MNFIFNQETGGFASNREALDAYVGTSEKDVRADMRARGLVRYSQCQ